MKRFLIALTLFSLLILASSAMSAIEVKYEGWEMTLEGRVSEEYTDNINFAGKNEDKVEKFMTNLSLSFDARYTGKRRTYDVRADLSRSFDDDNLDSLRASENIYLGFSHRFSEYSIISLSDSFHHSKYPVEWEEQFGRFRTDYETYNNRFGVDYARDLSEHLRIRVGYSNNLYWAEGFEGDSVENGVNLGLSYIYSAATSGSLSYNYSTRRYKDDGTADINSFSVGLKKYITKRLSLDGNVGLSFISPPEGNDSTTTTYGLNLTDEIDEKTLARLSFRRGANTTYEGDVFTSWQVSANLDRDLMEDLKGTVSCFYGEGEYTSDGTKDTFIGASGRVNYIFGKHLTGNLGYTYSNLDSTAEDREYTVNSISGGVTLTF
ncbi:MAG: hypothetical protein Fur0020_00100 [Thermodesulfovibrionia bacterium]